MDHITSEVTTQALSFEALRNLCSDQKVIEVQFDWEELAAAVATSEATIYRRALGTDVDLGMFFAPWYRTPAGEETSYLNPNSIPWSFAEVVLPLHVLPERRAHKIEHLVSDLRDGVQIVTLTVGNGRFLVLDGNYRFATWGCMLGDNSISSITELYIDASVTLGLVPDLSHWVR